MQKNKKYLLVLLSVVSMLLIFRLSRAQEVNQSQVGLRQVNEVSGKDWIGYNPNHDKLAVIETTSLGSFPALGKTLKIYKVGSDFQPQKVLFESKANSVWITEFRWIGDSLVYTTFEGFDKPEQVWSWFTGLRQSSNFASVPKHVKLRQWPKPAKNDLDKIYLFEPGQNRLFPLSPDKLLTINPLSVSGVTKTQLESTYEDTQLCKIFSISQDKLSGSFTIPIPNPGNRWWSQSGDFIPLFVSKDGKKLVAMVSGYYPWRARSKYNVPFIITIDLTSGKINAVTPDSEYHGLRSGRDLRYFEPGNPMPVNGGAEVVFNLNMVRTINDIIAYFAYYDLDGKRIKEVALSKQDLKHAGLPVGFLLTWTPDGKKVLFQAGDGVWLYDIENRTGKHIASAIWVEDVVSWIDGTHLLVRTRKLTKKHESSSKVSRDNMPQKIWGVLSLS